MNIRLALITLTLSLNLALAQEATPVSTQTASERAWVGLSTGFPFGVTLHLGLSDILADNADVRFIGSFYGDDYGLGIDALYGFGISGDQALDLYAGGGPLLSFGNGDKLGGEGFAAGVNAVVGLEYRLAAAGLPAGGVFVEAGPFLGFGDDTFLDVNARAGFNYHF